MKSLRVKQLFHTALVLFCLSNILSVQQAYTQQTDSKAVYQIAKSGNNRVLAVWYSSGMERSVIDLFDSSSAQFIDTVDLAPAIPDVIALSPVGDRIAHVGPQGDIGIFDINSRTDVTVMSSSPFEINALAWNPVNDELAFAMGGAVRVINTNDLSLLHSISDAEVPGQIVDLAWSWDGERVAISYYQEDPYNPSVSLTNTQIWDLTVADVYLTSATVTIENHGGGSLAWHPNNTLLALGEAGEIAIYSFVENRFIVQLPVGEEYFFTAVWNSDGSLLATGGDILRIWDTNTWEIIKTIPIDDVATSLQWSFKGNNIFNNGGSHGLYLNNVPVSEIQPPIANAGD